MTSKQVIGDRAETMRSKEQLWQVSVTSTMRKKQKLLERANRVLDICIQSHIKDKKITANYFLNKENREISMDGRVDGVKIKKQKRGITKIIFNSSCLEDTDSGIFNPCEVVDALLSSIKALD